jgi:hypothetical protein
VIYGPPRVVYSAPRVVYSAPRYYPAPLIYAPPVIYSSAPLYSSAPVYVEPPAPPVYVERNDLPPQAAEAAGSFWYFCADSNAYYPYVTQCASPWERVTPQPPSARR